MIQRKQTLWLLLASVATFLTLKLPFYTGVFQADNAYHELNGTETFLMLLLTSGLGVLALINIFLFKNRPTQKRICLSAILVEAVLLFFYIKNAGSFIKGTYSIWSVLHVVILITLILAFIGINNDEKLVKDSDRLR